jgi:hypothetical protein
MARQTLAQLFETFAGVAGVAGFAGEVNVFLITLLISIALE